MKYGLDDVRNVLERASARETSARVAVGAIAKGLLELLGIAVLGRVLAVGDVEAAPDAGDEAASSAPGLERDRLLGSRRRGSACSPRSTRRRPTATRSAASSRSAPSAARPGLGSHTEPRLRLDARLAAAAVGIQAMKGVEIGDAFANARLPGSAVHDELHYDDARGYWRETNRAGGIEGGMSNGEPVVLRVAMKPLPTLMQPAALGPPRHARGGRRAGRAQRHDGDRRRGGGGRGGRRVRARALRAREVRRRLDVDDMLAAHAHVPRAHPVAPA